MTKHEAITQGNIALFNTAELALHPLNPRQQVSDEEIALLAQSIVACGLIQNLSGIKMKGGKIGIVAGGRRLRALQLLARDPNHSPFAIPVALAKTEAEAKAWANAENTARKDLNPADEIKAYGAMAKTGAEVGQIAQAFAVSEAHVYKRLKLASLPHPVLEALREGIITLEAAKAFTICNDEKLALETLQEVKNGDVANMRILKRRLQPASVTSDDRRVIFVGLEAYQKAGGKITKDLFEDQVFFENPAILDDLFAQKLDKAADELEATGWAWVLERLEPILKRADDLGPADPDFDMKKFTDEMWDED